MEFPFQIKEAFPLINDRYGIIECSQLDGLNYMIKLEQVKVSNLTLSANQKLALILNEIGELSSKAQQLKATITSYDKVSQTSQKIFILAKKNEIYGLLKVGKKNLFYSDTVGKMKEISPLCVLDFYIYEGEQRKGYGKELFEFMLQTEIIKPNKLGYDRPSVKLLGFLRKHYNLITYIKQNNNFVIYNSYFKSNQKKNNDPNKLLEKKTTTTMKKIFK